VSYLSAFDSALGVGPLRLERRSYSRFPIDPKACWNINILVEDQLCFATVRNLSRRGIGLILDRKLEPGETLRAELTSLSGLSTRSHELRVTRVAAQSSGRYAVGCKFDQPLTHQQMETLLS
jgi:hypothetical protein